jgi:hypothetical protein
MKPGWLKMHRSSSFFFSGEPITSAPACNDEFFFVFSWKTQQLVQKKHVLSPVQSILFCMDSFRPSRAATVGRTRMTENSHGALPIPRRFVKGQLGVSKLEHVKTMLHWCSFYEIFVILFLSYLITLSSFKMSIGRFFPICGEASARFFIPRHRLARFLIFWEHEWW